MSSLEYLVALHNINGVGPKTLARLIDRFKDPKLIWEAKPAQFKEIGLYPSIISKLMAGKADIDPEKNLEKIIHSGIKVLTIFDADYPGLLKEIYDPPIILYYKGDRSVLNKKAIGVVGTRKVTGYGKAVTQKITKDLSLSGLVVVSGLARGVDSIAHRATLEAGGQTVAVLGGGLNCIYPPENRNLAREIVEKGGAVVTEFPPDSPHLAGNFPARNRIISALSLGILVTEAAFNSGSLITAKCALDQGRDVFAVPGPIDSALSMGPSVLIKNGAKLVVDYKDILEDLGLELSVKSPGKKNVQISKDDSKIIDCLAPSSKHLDEICRELNKKSSEVAASLVKMEIAGLVRNLGGGIYAATI